MSLLRQLSAALRPAAATVGMAGLAAAALLTGCAAAVGEAATTLPSPTSSSARAATPGSSPSSSATPDVPVKTSPTAAPEQPTGPTPSDGAPRDARLTVPDLGLQGVEVVSYEGFTDDAAGSAIQDEGPAASPHGPRGGTGPGGIGNYQVTAHRLSAGGLFRYLPDLDRGDRVRVGAGDVTYVYEIRRTRITSFRDPRSLLQQRAAVPGRPGATPTRAMITLSTCRTLEDHAEGNYWSDEFGNPENRIDKIGVLVRTLRG